MILSLYENIRVSENQYSRINYEVISEGYFLFVNFQSKAKNYLGRPNNTYIYENNSNNICSSNNN